MPVELRHVPPSPTPTTSTAARTTTAWAGPGGRRARREGFSWKRVLWRLLLPERGPLILPTAAGVVLLLLVFAVGSAAYNTGNNILFLTLALLLACLVLSGVLSWLNYSRVAWRLGAAPPFRAGDEAVVTVEMRNDKRVLPSYALSLEVEARRSGVRGELTQRMRLGPGENQELTWTFRPVRRGREEVRLARVGSLFPFGFLRKHLATAIALELKVWPGRIAYDFAAEAPARWRPDRSRTQRSGGDADLLGLRRYQSGDSHRSIHWKASARLGQLLVRQHAQETAVQFSLHLDTDAARWPRPEQFELLCRFAATLAEDLFLDGRLQHVAIDSEPPSPVRRVRELETFLDRLAELTPTATPAIKIGGTSVLDPATLIACGPDGERGVCARLGGKVVARA